MTADRLATGMDKMRRLRVSAANGRRLFLAAFVGVGLLWAISLSLSAAAEKRDKEHVFAGDGDRQIENGRPGQTKVGDKMRKIYADPFFKQLAPALGRGMNIGNALEAPKEGEWGVTLKEEYFERIKEAGFDSVRIPVCWSAHAAESPPYEIDAKFFERVDWAIDQALKRHLAVIVAMHHYNTLYENPDKQRERFLAIWRQIAEHYKDYPPELALELLNEPHANLTSGKWNPLLKEAIGVVRRGNPRRELVVGPIDYNNFAKLPDLELPEDDRHLIVDFHYYLPYHFTHQGAWWAGEEAQSWLGLKWLGTEAEKKAVTDDLDKAIAWAVAHRRPIVMGEFGAFDKADMESRARWTRFVADEALKRKIGFAYWDFCWVFGAYDLEKNQWIEPLKRALLDAGRLEKTGGK